MISCLPNSFRIWKRTRGGTTTTTTTTTTTELETTTSTCTTDPETVRRKHVFEVQGYSSLVSRVGAGSFVRSAAFEVGGHDWAVRFFPRGDDKSAGCAAVFAALLTPGAEARASCDLALVSRRLGVPNLVHRTPPWFLRHPGGGAGADGAPCLGSSTFVKTWKLEEPASPYVHRDCLRIECVITEFKLRKASRQSPAAAAAPAASLSQDLLRLLETKEGADVSFEVEGEIFAAHAHVLATRSAVFKAELYGPMKENAAAAAGGGEQQQRRRHISIADMPADIFRALLHFVYTDDALLLPPAGDAGGKEFVKHLLVAADRYDVRGLKQVCEKRVCESLTVATVASTFAFADRHSCSMLLDACVAFITGSDTLADVVASEGYRQLRSLCPGVTIDLFEKATMLSCKNHHA